MHPLYFRKHLTSAVAVRTRFLRASSALILIGALSGCASFSPDGGMRPVTQATETILQKDVAVIRNGDDAQAADDSVRRLSRKVLTADSAVQIALLNNRGLQAAYNELAIAEAAMVGDSLPPNPTFSISRIAGAGASELETKVALDILALATLPVRSEIAGQRFRQAQLQAIEETLRTAVEVRRAYYRALAGNELTELLAQAQKTAKATSELAAKLGETGSLNKLDQAREQVFYAETTAEFASARQDSASARTPDAPPWILGQQSGFPTTYGVASTAATPPHLAIHRGRCGLPPRGSSNCPH